MFDSRLVIAYLRSLSTARRSLAFRINALTCLLRSEKIPVTSPAVLSNSDRLSLRLLSDRDNRDRPSKVGPSCGEIWSRVCARVSNDWFSESVSVSAVFAVSSLTASVNEYGDDVRGTGMTFWGSRLPLPSESRASTRSPSSVPVRMCAVVSEPSGYLPATVNPTSASPLSSPIDDTEPTLIPDTVTSLPTLRPPASANNAWYRTEVAQDSRRSGCNPTAMTRMITTTPMKPALAS